MFRTLLLPTDGSPQSKQAIRQACELAKSLDARLVALHVTVRLGRNGGGRGLAVEARKAYDEAAAEQARKHLAVVEAEAARAGVRCITLVRVGEQVHRVILDTVVQQGCDAICMASHGRAGISALVLGSETTKVLSHATVPVIVFRRGQ